MIYYAKMMRREHV